MLHPLVFGAGTLAILVAATRYARRAGTRAATPKSLVLGTLWFVGIYFASGLGFRWPAALAGVFLVTWIGRIWLRPDRVSFALFSVLLAIAGSAFEAALSAAGGFAYALPGPLVVPLWLPGLYLHGAPLAVAIASRLGPGDTAGTPARTPAQQI